MVGALAQCVGYTEGSFLNIGQKICLPPYSPLCQHVIAAAAPKDECKVYTVQQGDTIASIASAFNIYVDWVTELNGVSVSPGQRIKLPPWYSRCPDISAAGSQPCRVYSVQNGESLFAIATGFHVTVEEIVAVNPGFTTDTILAPSQPVKIPPFTAECGAGTPVTGFPTDGVTTCRAYRIQASDSLYSIAVAFGSSANDIIALNPEFSTPSLLAPGATIKIPPWDDSCPPEGILVSPSDGSTPVYRPTSPGSSSPSTTPVPTAPAGPSPPPRLVGNGSPVPAVAVPPAPLTIDVASQTSKVEMVITGVTKDEFSVKQQGVVAAIAEAAGVPPANVSVTFVLPATVSVRRRMLDADNAVKVQCLVTGDPTAVQANLEGAQRGGTLNSSFEAHGMNLSKMTVINPTGQATPIVTAAPTTSSTDTSSGSSGYNLPIPLGALIGAGVGALVLGVGVIWLSCCLCKRRRQKKEQAAAAAMRTPNSKKYIGATAYINNSPSLRVKENLNPGNTLQDYKKHGYPPRSPMVGTRSPSRTPTRGQSRNRAFNDAYVISTTVSTPRREDIRLELPSRRPSSTASLCEVVVEEIHPMSALWKPPVAPEPQRKPINIPIIIQGPESEHSAQQQHSRESPKESVAGSGMSSAMDKGGSEGRGGDMSATARQAQRPMASSFQRTMQRSQEAGASSGGGEPSAKPFQGVSSFQKHSLQSSLDNSCASSSDAETSMRASPFQTLASYHKALAAAETSSPYASLRRRYASTPISPSKKDNYVSPYSQRALSGQVPVTPRSAVGNASKAAAGTPAGNASALRRSETARTPAANGYTSPYTQQRLRSPERTSTRQPAGSSLPSSKVSSRQGTPRAQQDRLTSYAEL